ncbi:unnamed protein product, partial [marine sediment metagenome]
MTICKEYESFLLEQDHLKESTRKVLRNTLKRFPPPGKLNFDWFKERRRGIAASTLIAELQVAKQVFRFLKKDTKDLERVKTKKDVETVTVEDL